MIISDFSVEFANGKSIRNFSQKEVYEPFLKDLMIQSSLFSNKIVTIDQQSNSESDFYDMDNNKYYDATLLLNNDMISNIMKNPKYIASQTFRKQREEDVIEIFRQRLARKNKKDSSIIIFNIIPDIFPKIRNSTTEILFPDEVDLIIDELLQKESIIELNRHIIFISFNCDNSFYIRTLNPKKDDLHFIDIYDKNVFPFKITRLNYIWAG